MHTHSYFTKSPNSKKRIDTVLFHLLLWTQRSDAVAGVRRLYNTYFENIMYFLCMCVKRRSIRNGVSYSMFSIHWRLLIYSDESTIQLAVKFDCSSNLNYHLWLYGPTTYITYSERRKQSNTGHEEKWPKMSAIACEHTKRMHFACNDISLPRQAKLIWIRARFYGAPFSYGSAILVSVDFSFIFHSATATTHALAGADGARTHALALHKKVLSRVVFNDVLFYKQTAWAASTMHSIQL